MTIQSVANSISVLTVCLAGAVSCQSTPPQPTTLRYAAVTTQPTIMGLQEPDYDPNQEVDESGPVVSLTTRVISGDAAYWGSWNPEGNDAITHVPNERVEEILNAVENHAEVRALTSPTVTLYSGQRGYTSVLTQRAYMKDLRAPHRHER